MATAEAETSQEERGAPGGSVYDGFISYSHAADDLLAPRLQAGLQRFAKPWWKRRALRIFRDESSLSANPHLWSSITDALDESAWFVVLLSPDAAESEWVNNEVEYWLEHKDPDRIIPVLTEGDFAWHDGHIVSDAAPIALQRAFSDEPRWVDLRFARTEDQLDLNNASFRAAIADIASAIRGIPKDELESEEVRQHRRTVRTAWAGGLAVLLLAVLAGAIAIYAVGQRDSAEQNEQAALQSEQAALQSEAEATEFARLVLGINDKLQSSAAPAGTNFVRDKRNIPLAVNESPPPTPRLFFLDCGGFNDSESPGCFQTARFLHPTEPIWVGVWHAYEPFHIRHGFVNDEEEPLGAAFPPDFDLLVYITRRQGPELAESAFIIGQTYRFTAEYLVRVTSDRCGPGWRTQTEPQPCDQFVHEFDQGLPPGAYDIWVEWWAPCSAWTTGAVCPDEDPQYRLFAAEGIEQPFYHNDFTPNDHATTFPDVSFFGDLAWPFDLWGSARQSDQ
jgi:type II secretory pathway pseudopilin PulG